MPTQRQEQDFERIILTLLEIGSEFAVLDNKKKIKIYLKGENKTAIILHKNGKWEI